VESKRSDRPRFDRKRRQQRKISTEIRPLPVAFFSAMYMMCRFGVIPPRDECDFSRRAIISLQRSFCAATRGPNFLESGGDAETQRP
jgi:hypothetical protein